MSVGALPVPSESLAQRPLVLLVVRKGNGWKVQPREGKLKQDVGDAAVAVFEGVEIQELDV